MENTSKYFLYKYIEINFTDPICSLFLSDNYVIVGTMSGKVILTFLENKKEIILIENSTENITGISFSPPDNYINICIGDFEIQRFQINESNHNNNITSYFKMSIHPSEKEHEEKCENSHIILYSDFLFRIQLQAPEEGNLNLKELESEYEIKNISNITNSQNKVSSLLMGNYSIPFDFNGYLFVWVEYLSTTDRRICCINFSEENGNTYYHEIKHEYGHISHIKIINENQILIAHSLNIIDRRLYKCFTLLEKFIHNGDQIYGINIYNYVKKETYDTNENDNENYNKEDNEGKNKILINKLLYNNKKKKNNKLYNSEYANQVCECDHSHAPILDKKIQINKYCIKNNRKSEKNMAIITLDIDGNVNWYENKKQKTLFNINDINDVIKDINKKKKNFFAMEYEYYIKNNLNYICITTDYGCLIFKKKE